MFCEELPLKFTVPVPAVNVPTPVRLPPTLSVLELQFNVPAVSATAPLTVCVKLVPKLIVPAAATVNPPNDIADVNEVVPVVFVDVTVPVVVKPAVLGAITVPLIVTLFEPNANEPPPEFVRFP